MPTTKRLTAPIRSNDDIIRVRRAARDFLEERKFSLIDQTKMITAASELARNILLYAGEGSVEIEGIEEGGRVGVKMTFRDQGPGISDIEQAMHDGFTTGNGLGLGLGGSKRLVNEFEIESTPGKGTRVSILRWKQRGSL